MVNGSPRHVESTASSADGSTTAPLSTATPAASKSIESTDTSSRSSRYPARSVMITGGKPSGINAFRNRHICDSSARWVFAGASAPHTSAMSVDAGTGLPA